MIKGQLKNPGTIIYFCQKHRNQSEKPKREMQAPGMRIRHGGSSERHNTGQAAQKIKIKKRRQNQVKSTAEREPIYKQKAKKLAAFVVQPPNRYMRQQLYQITREVMDYEYRGGSGQHSGIQEIGSQSARSYI